MKENLMKKVKKQKGFTLIELIIVVAIIAILVGLAIPKLMGIQQDSKIKTDIANAKTIADTTATLMTQDKITLDANGAASITLVNPPASDADGNTKALNSYLQTIPMPKAVSGKNFVVKIQKEVAAVAAVPGQNGGQGTPKVDAKEAKISVEVDGKEIYPEDKNNYGK